MSRAESLQAKADIRQGLVKAPKSVISLRGGRSAKLTTLRLALPRPDTTSFPSASSNWSQTPMTNTTIPVHLDINGQPHTLDLEPRVTLLDALRDRLGLTGTKKGCDHGQCGACTVHVDGERVLACLTLAAQAEGRTVTTIEGLAREGELHPVQAAFLDQDAFQCGYCTSGQIMSAVACIREGHAGSDDEIREYMAGNLCRCGAYPHIIAAVRQAALEAAS